MSAALQRAQALAAQAAATSVNMNEVEVGGGGKLLPEGYAFGRLVEYIDIGRQPQTFEGKAKDPQDEFRLGIALYGEGYGNEDGTPFVFRPGALKLSRFDKSTTFKAFAALNWTRDPNVTHFAQLLSRGYAFKVLVKKSKASGKDYNVIDWAATLAIDPISKAPYEAAIPPAPDNLYRVFFWDQPTLEDWDLLHIDGTRDDGKSKNWLQETILSAKNYEGSPLHILLATAGRPSAPIVKADPTPAQPAQAANVAVAVPVAVPTQIAAPAVATAVPATPVVAHPPVVDPAAQAAVAAANAVPVGVPTSPPVVTATVPSEAVVNAPLADPAASAQVAALPSVPQVPVIAQVPAVPAAQ